MAENVTPSPAKRPRKANFTPAEYEIIFELAEENLDIIKIKFSSQLTRKNKSKIWEEITERVNALEVCCRSVIEVKKKWRGMVSATKKEHNKCATSRKKTGGGKQPESPKEKRPNSLSYLRMTRHSVTFLVALTQVSHFTVCLRR